MTPPPTSAASVLATTDDWPVDHVSAAVVADGRVTSHGDADRVYALASVSKLVTAYAVLIAVEEGAFGLDDTVGDVAGEAGTAVDGPQDATVRQLLAHASGVGFRSRERERPAGRRRIYSSAGYEILADLIATTGIPFAGYVREAVCAPLGVEMDLGGSAGHGFRASLRAVTTLTCEFLAPTLVSARTWEEALSPQFPELDGIVPGYGRQTPCPWGLGPELRGGKSPHWTGGSMPADVAGHFGQSGTFVWFHRDSGRAAVVLTDRDFGDWAKERWAPVNDALWAAGDGR
ncbi:serine hydrolase domain-containing protein [Corynebacterium bovis]|nr:serine hydrolase domain-containing protein [Corynebacterium bovis]MDK8510160.1 serine hydrolase domain-containing protein [Corynebacterium bovis]RRO80809.1 serine hydrolase [Corynebacterium bovis]RRO90993.1 serine hydrolase [Corynebacterium bovis]RRO95410.1 serine hydrolase [Corynebacterium bovis]RRQ13768.1 serine hydrolase [Corynebacterium bovis]